MESARYRQGFSLIEIVVAVAIVAIIAGALAPYTVKRLNNGRNQATTTEMARIETALLDFFDDLGRFPSQSEGLEALAVSTDLSGQDLASWKGPYISGGHDDLVVDIQQDTFGSSYVYVAVPTLSPAEAGYVVLASPGVNKTQEMPDSGSTWVIANSNLYDDLVLFISSSSLNRQKKLETLVELNALADASREYYKDNSDFPANLAALAGEFIDSGFEEDAFSDEWKMDYQMSLDGGSPETMTLHSYGPDMSDDSGGDDDLVLAVSAAVILHSVDPN
ncbi:MAG: type II secretion system protein GspG [Gemmatimonadales bacterium]|nr:type II secretion system protein GspG [Gemmatimonadales bacterium]